MALVVFVQGLFELVGLGAFLFGYFGENWWLTIAGGLLIVLDDIIEVLTGVLNPTFPLMLSIGLALAFTPWYVGIFWASAGFKVLGIPTALKKVISPKQFADRAIRQGER